MGNTERLKTKLKFVFIPGLVILILVTALNVFRYQREFEFFKNIFNNEVVETRSMISRRLQSALITVEGVRALFIASQEVSKDEFDLFGSILVKNISSGSISIPAMIEWIDDKNIIRYAYSKNEDDNKKVVGLDLNQYPNRLLPIIKAKETRNLVATEPIIFVEGYPGLLIYSPIFKDEIFLGTAVVAIRLADLLAPISGLTPIYAKDTHIQTEDFIVPFDEDMIFNKKGERIINPQGDLVGDSVSNKYLTDQENMVSEDIVFANKVWQLKFKPTYIQEVNRRVGIYMAISVISVSTIFIFLWILNKQRERILKEKARTDALVLSIGDGLVVVDPNLQTIFINHVAEEAIGWKNNEILGKVWPEIVRLSTEDGKEVPEQERPLFLAIRDRKTTITTATTTTILGQKRESIVSEVKTIHKTYYYTRKDGKRFPVAITISPVVLENDVIGAIGIFRDITKESDVDRMKTEFLSLVSHQLLTPSTAIKWVTEFLLSGSGGTLNEKQTESLKSIYNSNESMIGLVNSLLNVSRIESGRIIVDPKPTLLSDLVADVLKELENKIQEKEQLVSFELEEGLPQINIDPRLIKEVYKNLLTNAIKYTPAKGKILVTIKKEKDCLVSMIKDSGYGILEKDKKRVFEKFYRGENIVAVEKDGNGLGLYLVKQIVDVSGGKIWFESEINKGATFWFSLPVSGSNPKSGEVTVS